MDKQELFINFINYSQSTPIIKFVFSSIILRNIINITYNSISYTIKAFYIFTFFDLLIIGKKNKIFYFFLDKALLY